MNPIIGKLYDILYRPGPRFPELEKWLRSEIWSADRFNLNALKPQGYLESGEKIMKTAEDLILNAAYGLYDELTAAAASSPFLLDELNAPKTALVIFDGLSIRELPLIEKLSLNTGFTIKQSGYRYAALPSDSLTFIEQRVIGKKTAPSQLENRKELKEKKIIARYYDTPIRQFEFPGDGSPLLLWSAFPDGTYMNFEARSSGHFEAIINQFDVAWKNIVLTIPRGYRIIITGDHGYVYLYPGYESDVKAEKILALLNNDRFRYFENNEELPDGHSELQILHDKRLAMIRGRIKNKPRGPAANKIFRHGGMSIMEMLVPFLEISTNN